MALVQPLEGQLLAVGHLGAYRIHLMPDSWLLLRLVVFRPITHQLHLDSIRIADSRRCEHVAMSRRWLESSFRIILVIEFWNAFLLRWNYFLQIFICFRFLPNISIWLVSETRCVVGRPVSQEKSSFWYDFFAMLCLHLSRFFVLSGFIFTDWQVKSRCDRHTSLDLMISRFFYLIGSSTWFHTVVFMHWIFSAEKTYRFGFLILLFVLMKLQLFVLFWVHDVYSLGHFFTCFDNSELIFIFYCSSFAEWF